MHQDNRFETLPGQAARFDVETDHEDHDVECDCVECIAMLAEAADILFDYDREANEFPAACYEGVRS